MYHLHCATCGLYLAATLDGEQARGVHYCPAHEPIQQAHAEPVAVTAVSAEDTAVTVADPEPVPPPRKKRGKR